MVLHFGYVRAAYVARGHGVAVASDKGVEAETERAPVGLEASKGSEDLFGEIAWGREAVRICGGEEGYNFLRDGVQGGFGLGEGGQFLGDGNGGRATSEGVWNAELGDAEVEEDCGLVVEVGKGR